MSYMPDIHDVARLAGVSKSTVSRVLTGNGPVKEETRIAVENAIKALDYSPSFLARGIRTGKTKTIGLLTPDYSNVYYNELFMGVDEMALQYGYRVIISNTHKDSKQEINSAIELCKRNVEGILYNTYKKNDENIAYFLALSKKIPVVFLDNVVTDVPDASFVITEGRESSAEAVRFLYERGCRRIAYVNHVDSVRHRYEGYLKGLADCGLEFDEDLVYNCGAAELREHQPNIGRETVKYFLGLKQPPDAIMAATDYMAISIIKHLKISGIKIPEQIKVVGYDNISLCEFVEPMLTTIAQPIKQIGRTAAEILIKKANGITDVEDRVIFKGKLVVREST
jgi:DNA-binding LacI/PurR family transcriptional regulator